MAEDMFDALDENKVEEPDKIKPEDQEKFKVRMRTSKTNCTWENTHFSSTRQILIFLTQSSMSGLQVERRPQSEKKDNIPARWNEAVFEAAFGLQRLLNPKAVAGSGEDTRVQVKQSNRGRGMRGRERATKNNLQLIFSKIISKKCKDIYCS